MPLKLIWAEQNLNEIVDKFSFEENFSESTSLIYYAELSHELKIGRSSVAVRQLFFTDAQIIGKKLSFWTPTPQSVEIKDIENLCMTIVEPGTIYYK